MRRSGGDPLERYGTYVIEVRGLDSLQNDDDVEVGIYSTDDESTRSQAGEHLPHQSFRVTPNPRWRTTTRGRIVDGVLMTDRIEVLYLRWTVSTTGPFGLASELEFPRRALPRVADARWGRDRDHGGVSAYRERWTRAPLLQGHGVDRELRLRVGVQDPGRNGRRVSGSGHGTVHDDLDGPPCGWDTGLCRS